MYIYLYVLVFVDRSLKTLLEISRRTCSPTLSGDHGLIRAAFTSYHVCFLYLTPCRFVVFVPRTPACALISPPFLTPSPRRPLLLILLFLRQLDFFCKACMGQDKIELRCTRLDVPEPPASHAVTPAAVAAAKAAASRAEDAAEAAVVERRLSKERASVVATAGV